jgi:hypothetical protein
VTRLAIDDHRTSDVARPLQQLPADARHLVVSVGGRNALEHLDCLRATARSVAEVLGRWAAIAIEPSVAGGAKIARVIATLMCEHDFGRGRTEVFV